MLIKEKKISERFLSYTSSNNARYQIYIEVVRYADPKQNEILSLTDPESFHSCQEYQTRKTCGSRLINSKRKLL